MRPNNLPIDKSYKRRWTALLQLFHSAKKGDACINALKVKKM